MAFIEVVLFLLLCSVALGWVAARGGFPYPIALVLGGNVLGFLPGIPEFAFDPQVLLVAVLPPILYQAALLTSWRDFKSNLRSIGLLAIGLVAVTTLAVGAALRAIVPDIPWPVAFAFGAIVSPPDAVAATAILSRLNLPRRIVTVLEGESLVNDASGLVLYKIAVAAALSGAFSFTGASLEFAEVSLGGTVIGLLLGWVFVKIHPHLKDPFFEVLTSLSIPYVLYVVAESLHVSGVLAVVAAGILRGRFTPSMVAANTRIVARSMWNMLVFILNSFIFILIGSQLSGVMRRLDGYEGWELPMYALAVSFVAIAVRFVWVYIAEYLPPLLAGRRLAAPMKGEAFVISWSGMRGIVSLAAALALPMQLDDGTPFPHRDLIVFLTFSVITVTLVLQGLTLTPIIKRLILGKDHALAQEHQGAKSMMLAAALEAIDKHAASAEVPAAMHYRVRSEFADRLGGEAEADARKEAESPVAHLRHVGIRAQREELIRIWRDGKISDEVMRHFEEELDYAEAQH